MKLLKIKGHTFRKKVIVKQQDCYINNFDGIENGRADYGPLGS